MLSVPALFLAIEAEVRSGDVACRLVRPVGYVGSQISEAVGEAALRLAVLGPSAALFAWALSGGFPADPRGLWLALPLGLVATFIAILFTAAIGLSAFFR